MTLIRVNDGWTQASGSLRWRITDHGFETKDGLRRSKILPDLPKQLWKKHKSNIMIAANASHVSPVLLLNTAVCESKGGTNVEYASTNGSGDMHIGICGMPTGLACAIANMMNWPQLNDVSRHEVEKWDRCYLQPEYSMLRGGELRDWRRFLSSTSYNSFVLVGRMFRFYSEWYGSDDPLVLYSAYHSGGLRKGNNTWGLATPTVVLETFANFYTLSLEAVNGIT